MLKDFFQGFVKIHILYHAGQEPVCGVEIRQELARHGYRLSPGTLYPTLQRLAQEGYLEGTARVVNGKVRRYYSITGKGRTALDEARHKIRELVAEVIEEA